MGLLEAVTSGTRFLLLKNSLIEKMTAILVFKHRGNGTESCKLAVAAALC